MSWWCFAAEAEAQPHSAFSRLELNSFIPQLVQVFFVALWSCVRAVYYMQINSDLLFFFFWLFPIAVTLSCNISFVANIWMLMNSATWWLLSGEFGDVIVGQSGCKSPFAQLGVRLVMVWRRGIFFFFLLRVIAMQFSLTYKKTI